MPERDWAKDWELCEKATPGPWYVKILYHEPPYEEFIKGIDIIAKGEDDVEYIITRMDWSNPPVENALFITEARDALPYWLQRVRELEAQVAVMREVLELCIPKDNEIFINAPEDSAVRLLCDMYGYGAVMTSVARQWRKKDPIGAFTIGPCLLTVQKVLKEVE